MSDIHLLLYEDYYYSVNEDVTYENFIKNEVGINVNTFIGGSSSSEKSSESSKNPLEKLILSELITSKNLINLFNNFFDNKNINITGNESEDDLLEHINTFWFQNMKYIISSIHNIYNEIIIKYITSLKNNLNSYENQIQFLTQYPPVDFLYNTINKIYIGSAGYNINKTNHWDVIYSSSPNQLDLYSQHFNSIEINDTYYNDEEKINWNNVKNNLIQINNSKFKCSILFSTHFSNIIINTNSDQLKDIIENEFNIYWKERIELIEDYIENIVFIFNSNFEYNNENFDKLKLLNDIILENYKDSFNFIFEIYNNDWYNKNVSEYFESESLSYVSLIVNNDNADFGYNFDTETNFEFINSINLPISYIKLYGSKNKYNGSHTSDLYKIIKTIKNNDSIDTTFISKINPNKNHFIYFNNLETDFNNIRYQPKDSSDDETLTSDIQITKGGSDNPDDPDLEEQPDDLEKQQDDLEEQFEDEPSIITEFDTDKTIDETMGENMNMPSAVFDKMFISYFRKNKSIIINLKNNILLLYRMKDEKKITDDMINQILYKLSIISYIKQGEKLYCDDESNIFIDNSYIPSISRYISNQNRIVTIKNIKDIIDDVIYITDFIYRNEISVKKRKGKK